MRGTTVLTDGSFTITWNGGYTFNVWALDREVNVFSSDYGNSHPTEEQARKHAHEWWTGEGWNESSGKEDTQNVIRNQG